MMSNIFKLLLRKPRQNSVPPPEASPDAAMAHYRRGNQLRDQGELEAAVLAYDRAIEHRPDYASALCNRGVVLHRLNRRQEALQSFSRAIEVDHHDVLAYYNRAAVLRELERPEAALASYEQALEIKPDYLEALYNRGNLLAELDRPLDALASYGRCTQINPRFHHAYLGRGAVHLKLRQWDAALAAFAQAIEVSPECAEAHSGRGIALYALRQWDAALENLSKAIALKPDLAEAHCGRGNVLMELNRRDEAIASFDTAVAVDPAFMNGLQCRADALYLMKRYEAARASYEQILAVKPDFTGALGMHLFLKLHLCDWRNFESELRQLAAAIEAGKPVTPPFQALSLLDSPALHLRAALTWTLREFPPDPMLGEPPKRAPRDKVRIGYFSADFKEHPVAMVLAQILELHDRSRFETIAFSFGEDTRDAMRVRLEGAFDRFIDVRGRSDPDIALLARSLEIDIAVDLMGYTGGGHTRVFALRAAPVQVNYLGYPGTMGASYMDYLLGDTSVTPLADRAFFSEKIVSLPGSYLPNDATRRIGESTPERAALGLPPTGFVFCCFNGNYKITPGTFDSWMRILNLVAGSVLWLSGSHPTAVNNLRREAAQRGVEPQRLIFASRVADAQEHLARLRAADLFLDTLPYNAHATAVDALWAGLPVLTLRGQAFAGRVGAGLLSAIELPELIASTSDEYEQLAVELARAPARLVAIKQKLAQHRSTAPLFDTAAFTRHLEAAYSNIMDRYRSGLPPEHFQISDPPVHGR